MAAPDLQHTVETVWRMESAKIIAALTRLVRDVGVTEELAHDALVAALEQWPTEGIPRNPAAWLMGTAKHRALDRLRREPMLERRHEQLGYEMETGRRDEVAALDDALDDDVGDDLLRLVFTACHPVLSKEAQVALTLRLLCGLTTDEIARAFLVPEPTVAQRIVRAKKTLAKANVPFEVPRGEDRDLVDALADEPALKAYHLVPAVRGDCLERLQRLEEASREFERAASLAGNERERELLRERAANAKPT